MSGRLAAAALCLALGAAPAWAAGAPAAQPLARAYGAPFRSDVVDIPLGTAERGEGETEFKVKMKAGATLIYAWSVSGLADPEEFYSDLHSQSVPSPQVWVLSHEARTGAGGNGALVAPFEGVHGWYLQNQSAAPVVVHLQLAGFYERMTPEDVARAEEQSAREQPYDPAAANP